MIRTDGRPTIANAPVRPKKKLTREECIELARKELALESWPPAEPQYGGHN